MTKREQELYKDIAGIIVVILLGALAWHFFGCTDISLYPVQENKDMSLLKGRVGTNLIPVGIDDFVISVYNETTYTGHQIVDFNKDWASSPCVVTVGKDSNHFIPDPFVSVDSLNTGFVIVRGAILDTLTGELASCWEYSKDEFYPQGQPILGSNNSISPNGTITFGNFDVYDQTLPAGFQPRSVPTNTQYVDQIISVADLEPLQSGINVVMVKYNASRNYKELDYNDNDLFYAFRWHQTYQCWTRNCDSVLVVSPEVGSAAFNGDIENRWITTKVKNGLKNMRNPLIITDNLIKSVTFIPPN